MSEPNVSGCPTPACSDGTVWWLLSRRLQRTLAIDRTSVNVSAFAVKLRWYNEIAKKSVAAVWLCDSIESTSSYCFCEIQFTNGPEGPVDEQHNRCRINNGKRCTVIRHMYRCFPPSDGCIANSSLIFQKSCGDIIGWILSRDNCKADTL